MEVQQDGHQSWQPGQQQVLLAMGGDSGTRAGIGQNVTPQICLASSSQDHAATAYTLGEPSKSS